MRAREAWEALSLFRHLGIPGGGRQRTLAGVVHDLYLCAAGIRAEDNRVRIRATGPGLFDDQDESR